MNTKNLIQYPFAVFAGNEILSQHQNLHAAERAYNAATGKRAKNNGKKHLHLYESEPCFETGVCKHVGAPYTLKLRSTQTF